MPDFIRWFRYYIRFSVASHKNLITKNYEQLIFIQWNKELQKTSTPLSCVNEKLVKICAFNRKCVFSCTSYFWKLKMHFRAFCNIVFRKLLLIFFSTIKEIESKTIIILFILFFYDLFNIRSISVAIWK